MKAVHLAFTAAAVLAAVTSIVLFFLTGNQKAVLKQQLAAANGRLTVLEARSAKLSSQRDAFEARAGALEEQLGESKSKSVALEARATQLAREVQQAREELAGKADAGQAQLEEIARLRRDLVDARGALLEDGSRNEVAALQARIDSLEAELASRGSGDHPVPAQEAGISPERSPHDPDIQGASILSVGTKSAFVVLNIGSVHGARPGLQLSVARQGLSFARLQISEVNENYSIAQVEAGSLTGKIRVGDTAVILN